MWNLVSNSTSPLNSTFTLMSMRKTSIPVTYFKKTFDCLYVRSVWPNGWVFVYELSGCGFESSCSHLKLSMIQLWMYLRNFAGTRTTSFPWWSNDQQENIFDLKPRELFCHLDLSRQGKKSQWWHCLRVNIIERFHTYSMLCQRVQKNFYGGSSW